MNDKELVKKEENAYEENTSEKSISKEDSSKKVTAWKIAALEKNRLSMDDMLSFSCDNCGECCKHQNDLIMNPYDIFRLAKRLDLTPKEWMDLYADVYIGSESRVPVVRIKMIGDEMHCPFLKNNRCTLHRFKPDVCALYPLGRAICYHDDPKEITTNEPEVVYFHSGCKCGTEQNGQTVKKWLDSFGLMEREHFFIRWTKVIREVSAFVRSLEKTMDDEEILKTIWGLIILQLYADYDIHQDFEPQFEKNFKELQEHMEKIQGIRRAYHEGELQ